ncbi:MAG TPA: TetR/AcrR family transcriptional regulator [Duganella sp.]|uniref:TetR/AcrR family transcriptional regulator n=1 Tax=Duganella sp. TaxID=1904440 RepID=UPI002ED3B27A
MSTASTYPGATRGPADHEVRDQIALAATAHFRLYGYEKTTVSDLAKAIGFSKAYIYKFFQSKQAIGELICANCLRQIEADARAAVDGVDLPQEKLRRLFKVLVESSLRLFCEDRKLYDIAAAASCGQWQAARTFDEHVKAMLADILRRGRELEEFERKTPFDETAAAIYLVVRPYLNPPLLRNNLDSATDAASQLSSLVLRSLSP